MFLPCYVRICDCVHSNSVPIGLRTLYVDDVTFFERHTCSLLPLRISGTGFCSSNDHRSTRAGRPRLEQKRQDLNRGVCSNVRTQPPDPCEQSMSTVCVAYVSRSCVSDGLNVTNTWMPRYLSFSLAMMSWRGPSWNSDPPRNQYYCMIHDTGTYPKAGGMPPPGENDLPYAMTLESKRGVWFYSLETVCEVSPPRKSGRSQRANGRLLGSWQRSGFSAQQNHAFWRDETPGTWRVNLILRKCSSVVCLLFEWTQSQPKRPTYICSFLNWRGQGWLRDIKAPQRSLEE